MAPRGIPADILALSVPVLFAGAAFSGMFYRIVRHDPEQNTLQGFDDDKVAIARGEHYKNSIRQMFTGGKTDIFNNNVSIQRP
ncbi:hypothetical protein HYH03_005088 [Edaphochlamys debaryana]|uniref:Uncharacterized protein n=1 Tax=Edaphochlamys debaryana TaxID=47281 RepID=A0A835YFJ1_9CHLO|nr:hypothetical protein HYH03_005088 [Edaphochlamys debaryana]|eukprot:KAG2496669.1 hypothetical protein HYH03_005088 [Edaphochlamys debaryana]